jgi:hypothetical protein
MRHRLLSGRAAHVLALALVVVSVCVGLCLFDGHGHDGGHSVAFDLCLGLALLSVAALGFTSIVIHPIVIERPLAVRVRSFHTPDPPPKHPSRF